MQVSCIRRKYGVQEKKGQWTKCTEQMFITKQQRTSSEWMNPLRTGLIAKKQQMKRRLLPLPNFMHTHRTKTDTISTYIMCHCLLLINLMVESNAMHVYIVQVQWKHPLFTASKNHSTLYTKTHTNSHAHIHRHI